MFSNNMQKRLFELSITVLICVVLGWAQAVSAASKSELKRNLFDFLTDMPEIQFQMHPDDIPEPAEKYYLIVDVRSSDEYTVNHIRGAINLPFSDNQEQLEANLPIDKKTDILLYSQDATRSIYALIFYYLSGYENVRYIDGGLNRWKTANRNIKVLPHVDDIATIPTKPATPVIHIVRN